MNFTSTSTWDSLYNSNQIVNTMGMMRFANKIHMATKDGDGDWHINDIREGGIEKT